MPPILFAALTGLWQLCGGHVTLGSVVGFLIAVTTSASNQPSEIAGLIAFPAHHRQSIRLRIPQARPSNQPEQQQDRSDNKSQVLGHKARVNSCATGGAGEDLCMKCC
jgi:hypothetical protein